MQSMRMAAVVRATSGRNASNTHRQREEPMVAAQETNREDTLKIAVME